MKKRVSTARNQMGLLAPSLEQVQVPIDSVKPHPENDNEGDVEFIKESIRAHGLYKPIVIQASTRHICAGNHTWLACKELDMETVAAVELDISDEQALAILDMDNEASRRATFNAEIKRRNLKKIQSSLDVEELPLFAASVMDRLEDLEGAAELPNRETDAAHAESPEQFAERAAHVGKPPSSVVQGLKEVVLMFRQEDYERFLAVCKAARAGQGFDSNTGVVIAAMRHFNKEAWEGAEVSPENGLNEKVVSFPGAGPLDEDEGHSVGTEAFGAVAEPDADPPVKEIEVAKAEGAVAAAERQYAPTPAEVGLESEAEPEAAEPDEPEPDVIEEGEPEEDDMDARLRAFLESE